MPIGGNLNVTATTVNFDALNLWWQMEHLPTFMQSWQSFSQVTNKFMEQFQQFYYANGMYAGQFNDTTWVNNTLFGFAPTNNTNPVINTEIETRNLASAPSNIELSTNM